MTAGDFSACAAQTPQEHCSPNNHCSVDPIHFLSPGCRSVQLMRNPGAGQSAGNTAAASRTARTRKTCEEPSLGPQGLGRHQDHGQAGGVRPQLLGGMQQGGEGWRWAAEGGWWLGLSCSRFCTATCGLACSFSALRALLGQLKSE